MAFYYSCISHFVMYSITATTVQYWVLLSKLRRMETSFLHGKAEMENGVVFYWSSNVFIVYQCMPSALILLSIFIIVVCHWGILCCKHHLNKNVLQCLLTTLKSTAHLVKFLFYSHTADKSILFLSVSNANFKLETAILRF